MLVGTVHHQPQLPHRKSPSWRRHWWDWVALLGPVPTPEPEMGLAPYHAGGPRAPARRARGRVGAEPVPGQGGVWGTASPW